MEINDFKQPKRGGRAKLILRSQVEDAIQNTRSNSQAARYLGVNILTYKKYASLYGLWDQHNNKNGVGITKGFIKNAVKLEDVFAGKHPKYSLVRLKHRMIARKLLKEECSICGFDERRITDKKSPLILTFKDGDRTNYSKDNLHLVCYNCMFLTAGSPSVAHKSKIIQSFNNPDLFTSDRKFKVGTIEKIVAAEVEKETLDTEEVNIDFEELRNQLLDQLEGN
jgi:hypothetical protein